MFVETDGAVVNHTLHFFLATNRKGDICTKVHCWPTEGVCDIHSGLNATGQTTTKEFAAFSTDLLKLCFVRVAKISQLLEKFPLNWQKKAVCMQKK